MFKFDVILHAGYARWFLKIKSILRLKLTINGHLEPQELSQKIMYLLKNVIINFVCKLVNLYRNSLYGIVYYLQVVNNLNILVNISGSFLVSKYNLYDLILETLSF